MPQQVGFTHHFAAEERKDGATWEFTFYLARASLDQTLLRLLQQMDLQDLVTVSIASEQLVAELYLILLVIRRLLSSLSACCLAQKRCRELKTLNHVNPLIFRFKTPIFGDVQPVLRSQICNSHSPYLCWDILWPFTKASNISCSLVMREMNGDFSSDVKALYNFIPRKVENPNCRLG
jgi:hypothetical protein